MPKQKFDFRPEDYSPPHQDESYAHWMRECLIYRVNEIIGWKEGDEKTGTSTDFYNAQMDTQKIRQRTTHVYHAIARADPTKCPPLWTFGAAFYQHYAIEKNDYKKVLEYHQNKMLATAQKIHNKFLDDQRKAQKKDAVDSDLPPVEQKDEPTNE